MYKNGFVLTILKSGTPVRESINNPVINGTVTIPFGNDYQIRVKNKTGYRAMFEINIDGTNINTLGRYIINAGDTVTLDRYMGSSLSEGRKFKFVSATDSRVSDPTSGENGIIELKAWKERVIPVMTLIEKPTLYGSPYNWRTMHTNTAGLLIGNSRGSSIGCQKQFTMSVSSYVAQTSDQAGASIEGGHSNQSFSYGDSFETEDYPTTVSLKIVGPKRVLDHDEIIFTHRNPAYGHKFTVKKRVKYCGNCGNERKRFDKFCPDCGRPYVKKRG